MRGERVTRYHEFTLTFDANAYGRATGQPSASTTVRAYGWKDALNQAEREFNLDRVRFIDHPANGGVATAYMDLDGRKYIVGQVTAKRTDG